MDLSLHKKLFKLLTYVSLLLFLLSFAGIVAVDPQQLQVLSSVIKYYVAAFLLIRFNPFFEIKTRDTEFERSVAFSAGIFLLLTTAVSEIALSTLVPHLSDQYRKNTSNSIII